MKPLCTLAELPDGGIAEAELGDDSIILLRLGERVCAYLNVCPHAGRPLNWAPGRFLYQHGQLVCASHGAAFQPEDGLCIGGPCRGQSLQPVAVQVREGAIYACASARRE